MWYSSDYDQYAFATARTLSHPETAGGSDVFPFPAPAMQRDGCRIQFRLQRRKYFPVARGKDAVVTDVHKAMREYMLGISPDELAALQGLSLIHI